MCVIFYLFLASSFPAVPNPSSGTKQQLFLSPCESSNDQQRFTFSHGQVRLRSNPNICIMWNLRDKTRLWSIHCNEQLWIECRPSVGIELKMVNMFSAVYPIWANRISTFTICVSAARRHHSNRCAFSVVGRQ